MTTSITEKDESSVDAAARAERRLWMAVVVQAVQDWCSTNAKQHAEAEVFLFGGRDDFATVCASAGLDSRHLLEKLERLKPRTDSLSVI
jgi:hypothetical protein